jgi:crotonobetainyl-CoA:carnitine CoA-transferase CaiB-like acyl-CoA transferase
MESMLSDYRVLDLTDEKGLLCARILGDLGADVIKIERPGGDIARCLGPFYKDEPHPEKSLYWFFYNFNKKGITLNIETVDGRDLLKRMIEEADFLVESYPPGYLDRLGLGYDALKKINPRIIMTSITPFGQDGPLRDCKTTDLVAAASGGLVFILGDEDRPPVRITAEQSYCQAAAQGAAAALMALYRRQARGKGKHVDVSIQEAMTWPLSYTVPFWECNRMIWQRAGGFQKRADVRIKMLFPCKDGFINYRLGVAALWGRSQKNLVRVMNREGYGKELKDVDWSGIGMEDLSQEEHDRWVKPIEAFFMQHTRQELYELSQMHNFQLAPVNSPKEVVESRQLEARKYWINVEHPELDETIPYPGGFYKSDETEVRIRCRAPLIGEHNKEIYKGELGLSSEDLCCLKQAGVL